MKSSFGGSKRAGGIVLWFIIALFPSGFLGCIHLALGRSKIIMNEGWLILVVYL